MDNERVAQAYDQMPEYEWHRLERHPAEYGLTLRAMREYLPPPPARIIDVGGSVGRYSIDLARRGYRVSLVDISAKALEFARQKAAEAGVELAAVVQADARDLSALADGSFDAALVMGPLYHLLEHGQRLAALREARRVLRPGGVVLAAFITPTIVIQSALAIDIEYIVRDPGELDSILTTGIYRPRMVEGFRGFPDAWFSRPAEAAALMAEGRFEKSDLLNTEALARQIEANLVATRPDVREKWLDLLYSLSRDETMIGCGGHLLYVGTRPSAGN